MWLLAQRIRAALSSRKHRLPLTCRDAGSGVQVGWGRTANSRRSSRKPAVPVLRREEGHRWIKGACRRDHYPRSEDFHLESARLQVVLRQISVRRVTG